MPSGVTEDDISTRIQVPPAVEPSAGRPSTVLSRLELSRSRGNTTGGAPGKRRATLTTAGPASCVGRKLKLLSASTREPPGWVRTQRAKRSVDGSGVAKPTLVAAWTTQP